MARGQFDESPIDDLRDALWRVEFDAIGAFRHGDVVYGRELGDVRYLANVGAVSKATGKAKRFLQSEAKAPEADSGRVAELEAKVAQLEAQLEAKAPTKKELAEAQAAVETMGGHVLTLVQALQEAGLPIPDGIPVLTIEGGGA